MDAKKNLAIVEEATKNLKDFTELQKAYPRFVIAETKKEIEETMSNLIEKAKTLINSVKVKEN